jgi:autotransporter-associated beta strand protein
LILSGNHSGTGSVVMADGATLQLVANSGNISTVGGVPTSSVLGNNPASGSTGFQLGYNDNGSVRIELRSDSSVAFANTTTGNNSGNVTLNFDVNNVAAISGSGPQNQTLTFAPAGEISRNSGYGLTTYNTTINATGGNGYTLAIDKITSYGSGLNINANSAKVQIGSIGETGSTTLGFAGAYDTAVTGPISNSGGTLTLNKSGAGTLTFQGNNTYSGTTTISAGKLVLSGNNTTSGNMIIADSSTLQLVANSGNISTVGGVPTSSALGNNTASGTTGFQLGNNDNGSVGIQLRGDSSVAFANTTTGNNTSNVTLNFDVNNVAAISGSGPQNQILTFAPAGETSRNSGNGLTTGNTSINAAGGNGYTLAIDRITSNGGLLSINANTAKVQINSIAETGSTTLSFGGAANTTVTGPISNSSGTLTLNKGGTGTLMLQGNNTYTGATNVNQGQLIIDGGDLADVSTVNVAGSASLQVISGAPILGNVAGSGSTSISGAGTVLTVSSLSQSNLTIGAGTTLVIAPIPGGPLSAYDLKTVPEPQTFIMLLIALAMAAMVRKSRR